MYELSLRIQSNVPGPVSRYGYSIRPSVPKIITYDGQFIPAFLLKQKTDHRLSREFLMLNRIGSAFEELEPGTSVILPNGSGFLQHPDA